MYLEQIINGFRGNVSTTVKPQNSEHVTYIQLGLNRIFSEIYIQSSESTLRDPGSDSVASEVVRISEITIKIT